MKTVLLLTAFICAFAAFVALSLAMERHFRDVMGSKHGGFALWQPRLRIAGVTGLLASLLVCLLMQGMGQGWVLWLGVLTTAALAQILALTYAWPKK